MLNYALTSTSSPSSQTSSIPESELVLDSSSGLLVKKSDEIRSSDSPTIEINGINCNDENSKIVLVLFPQPALPNVEY